MKEERREGRDKEARDEGSAAEDQAPRPNSPLEQDGPELLRDSHC